MATRLSIRDVANAAGVSRATVSQVLSGRGRISDDTRRKVDRVMQELGYVYNRAAASLRAGQSTTVAIAVPGLNNPFFAELATSAADTLERAGYVTAIADTHDELSGQARFHTMLYENMMAGALMCPASSTTGEMAKDIRAGAPPIVGVLRPSMSSNFDFIGVDNFIGMTDATEHLIELGHQSIGFVGGKLGSKSREERLSGWRTALGRSGLRAPDVWVQPCDASISAGSQAIATLLARSPELTAVVCHQDIVAFGVTIGLRKMGIEPGRGFSVVGFDDISSAADWDPALTTMAVTPSILGAEAARLLLRRIQEPQALIQTLVLRPRLAKRGSSGAPSFDRAK
jgi:LacI family transcriptional regulator